ncbi:MAG TPA: Fe-S-containing protein [Candidatus Angelobacter sp.]
MLQALIVTLREGVEAALIVGITLAYLSKIGRPDLRKMVYGGLAVALVSSVAGAIVLSRFPEFNQDKFEGWVMLVAAFFVVSMVIFMMRTGRKMKGEIETKVSALAGAGSNWGLFAFVFLMVFREGVETVLILKGVSLDSSDLMSFIGTLLGVALAVIFGVLFVKGSVRIDLQKFFRVTSVILFFVAFQLVISGYHELAESGVFRSSKQEMALIGPIVRNEFFFPVTILALILLMILLEYRRRKPEAVVAASKAEERRLQWTARRERLWAVTLCATAFIFIVAITADFIDTTRAAALSPADAVVFDDHGQVRIPVANLQQGELHRYSATVNGIEVRFLLFRNPAGQVKTVFDACQICGGSGFYKNGNGIYCKNCAAPVNAESVGDPGGCNPIPLQSVEEKDDKGNVKAVVISMANLAQQSGQFTK